MAGSVEVFDGIGGLQFVEGIDYEVEQTGTLTSINPLPGASLVVGDAVAVNYEYRIDPQSKTATTDFRAGLGWERGWLRIRYDHDESHERLLSGARPGVLRDSERESTSGARSRAATRIVHAADAGVQLARAHLLESPPFVLPINVTMGNATIQSRTRAQTTPVDLDQTEGFGDVPEGYAVNLGTTGAAYVNEIYRLNITATQGTSAAELEAKLSRLSVDGQGY